MRIDVGLSMISNSILATTVIDLAIVSIAVYFVFFLLIPGRHLAQKLRPAGPITFVAGVAALGLFYALDLVTMHVLPIFMPRSEAMEVMRNLRVNQSWLILPASVVLIGFGALRSGRRVVTLFLNLDEKSAAAVESERRYALAIAGTDAGIWDWNLNTGEIFRSRRWHDMLGYAGTEVESRVEAHLDLLHPDDLSMAQAAMRSHLEDDDRYDVEFRLRHKKGHYLWVHARGQAIWDSTGNPVRMAGSITDISDRKEADEERFLAVQETLFANRAKTEFFANTSHELRTPMNAIIGFCEQLAFRANQPDDNLDILRIFTNPRCTS